MLLQLVESCGPKLVFKPSPFPAISTGVYGYPISEAAVVSSRAIEQFLRGDKTLKEVRLVFFGSDDAEVFLNNNVFSG